jgi:hypothetical protein
VRNGFAIVFWASSGGLAMEKEGYRFRDCEILRPVCDVAFKATFSKDEEMAMDLITSYIDFGKPVTTLEYINTELSPDMDGGKSCRLDVSMVHCEPQGERISPKRPHATEFSKSARLSPHNFSARRKLWTTSFMERHRTMSIAHVSQRARLAPRDWQRSCTPKENRYSPDGPDFLRRKPTRS